MFYALDQQFLHQCDICLTSLYPMLKLKDHLNMSGQDYLSRWGKTTVAEWVDQYQQLQAIANHNPSSLHNSQQTTSQWSIQTNQRSKALKSLCYNIPSEMQSIGIWDNLIVSHWSNVLTIVQSWWGVAAVELPSVSWYPTTDSLACLMQGDSHTDRFDSENLHHNDEHFKSPHVAATSNLLSPNILASAFLVAQLAAQWGGGNITFTQNTLNKIEMHIYIPQYNPQVGEFSPNVDQQRLIRTIGLWSIDAILVTGKIIDNTLENHIRHLSSLANNHTDSDCQHRLQHSANQLRLLLKAFADWRDNQWEMVFTK